MRMNYLVPRVDADPVRGVGGGVHAPADHLNGMSAERLAGLVLVDA